MLIKFYYGTCILNSLMPERNGVFQKYCHKRRIKNGVDRNAEPIFYCRRKKNMDLISINVLSYFPLFSPLQIWLLLEKKAFAFFLSTINGFVIAKLISLSVHHLLYHFFFNSIFFGSTDSILKVILTYF